VFLDVAPENVGADPQFLCFPENQYWRPIIDQSGRATIFFSAPVAVPNGSKFRFVFASAIDGKTILDSVEIEISNGAPNPPPPGPTPPPPAPVNGLVQFVASTARALVPQKDLLMRTAPALAASYESIIAGRFDRYATDEALIDATRKANDAALGDAAGAWLPFRVALGDRLTALEAAGQWAREDWAAGYAAIAAGLREAAR
jgi:hypothetical protein